MARDTLRLPHALLLRKFAEEHRQVIQRHHDAVSDVRHMAIVRRIPYAPGRRHPLTVRRGHRFPMLGNLAFTFARTVAFSDGVPCWATLANAFRAWLASGIGYEPLPLPLFPSPFPGNAKSFAGSAL